MSKAFIAKVILDNTQLSAKGSALLTNALIDAIVKEMRTKRKFTLPSFGTFSVRKMKARKALNPKTGEQIRVKASKTVRFKASPVLRKSI